MSTLIIERPPDNDNARLVIRNEDTEFKSQISNPEKFQADLLAAAGTLLKKELHGVHATALSFVEYKSAVLMSKYIISLIQSPRITMQIIKEDSWESDDSVKNDTEVIFVAAFNNSREFAAQVIKAAKVDGADGKRLLEQLKVDLKKGY